MALQISDRYTDSNPPDAEYPGGSVKNSTTPTAKDGTPVDKDWLNDYVGFTDALLADAGVTASTDPDTALASDRLNAIKRIAVKPVTTIAQLVVVSQPYDGMLVKVSCYHDITHLTGVTYRWDPLKSKSLHDGGLIIDPLIAFPEPWTGAYLDPVNAGTGCWVLVDSGPICIGWYGAKADDSTDDTNSVKKWIAAGETHKRELYGDVNGACKTTETIYLPTETILRTNSGGRDGQGFRIKAYHTGAAVLSLKGAVGVYIDCLNLETDSLIFPKTGICLGRDTVASAGHHKLSFVRFQGYASVAAVYSIASEVNYWSDLYCWLLGGGALHTFYTSEQDDFAVDSLVKSTNIQGSFKQAYLLNYSTDADSSCFYCEMGPNTGDWNVDGYLIPTGGSYARLNTAVANFPEAPGVQPFVPGSMTFRFGGERLGPTGNPLYGVRLTTDTPVKLKNFGFTHSRFDFQAGADKYQLFVDDDYILETPNVVLGPPEAFAYALVSFNPSKILGGVYSVDRLSLWQDLTLEGTWNDSLGAPYVQASMSIDGFRNVKLRGNVSGGTGLITTLPYGPSEDMLFQVVLGAPPTAGFGQLLLQSNGNLSLNAGSGDVDLSNVEFRI